MLQYLYVGGGLHPFSKGGLHRISPFPSVGFGYLRALKSTKMHTKQILTLLVYAKDSELVHTKRFFSSERTASIFQTP